VIVLFGAIAVAWQGLPAVAHPHVFVEARAVLVFAADRTVEAVRNEWSFDAAFSAYAVTGLDANANGQFEPEELAPLAQLNVASLADYGYFTDLVVDGVRQDFKLPSDAGLAFDGAHLTLFFELPLDHPVFLESGLTLQIFDPSYFVGFAFSSPEPVALEDAPADCHVAYLPPRGLDPAAMAALGALPSNQQALPPALAAVTDSLAGYHAVSCHTMTDAGPTRRGGEILTPPSLFDLPAAPPD